MIIVNTDHWAAFGCLHSVAHHLVTHPWNSVSDSPMEFIKFELLSFNCVSNKLFMYL